MSNAIPYKLRVTKSRLPRLGAAALLIVTAFASGTVVAEESKPTLSKPVSPHVISIDPSKLPIAPPTPSSVTVPEGGPFPKGPTPERKPQLDPVMQGGGTGGPIEALDAVEAIGQISDPDVNVAGINSRSNPPDTVGDVGPNHYVQMVNSTQFQVWDKQGTSILGPLTFGSLWPAGDPCRSDNWGDPIVVYDHLADRWLLSQFDMASLQTNPDGSRTPIGPFFMCIAISQTPDPTDGNWYLYNFETDEFPDYPKFGVWPDGYYMSSNESDLGVYVFDRTNMLLGNAAHMFRDAIAKESESGVRATRILPSDLDGPSPPHGTPNYFVHTVDDQQDSGSNDRIEIYEAAVDWNASSFSFTLVETLDGADGLAPFQIMLCDRAGDGGSDKWRDCIPQPDGAGTVDALSNRPMMQLKFRNYDDHFAMVFNQTIDVSGSLPEALGIANPKEVAGIRWYELHKSGANWTIGQQGTYAPQPIGAADEGDLLHRWMGSAALDKDGNIALGYSIVNGDMDAGEQVYASIRYTGRLSDDTPNLMPQGEKEIRAGTATQGGARWGDYSALSVDPVDDCTFWYTTHMASGEAGSRTQIASFRFDTCATDLEIIKTVPIDSIAGEELFYGIQVTNHGPINATNVTVVDTLPAGVTYLADTDSCVEAPEGTLTCDLGNLSSGESKEFTIKVLVDSDLVVLDGTETITNTATVSADQGELNDLNNTDEVTTIIQDKADLKVTKLCKPDSPLLAGENGICEIFVDNLGPSYARDVLLVDQHVADGPFTIVSAPGCTIVGNVVTCDLGTLPSNSPDNRATITIELTADNGVDINNTAQVSSATSDPNLENNSATDGISVTPVADLAIIKSDSPDPVIAGEQLTYDLTVTNNGPSEAVNVLIEDIVPAGVSIDSVSAPGGSCNAGVPGDSSQPTTCTFNSLAVGNVGAMTIVVTVLPDTLSILHNDAEVSSDTFDDDNSNDLASTDTTVDSEADLVVTKTDSPDPVLAGAPLTYTIEVTNNGPSTSLDVMLSDTLPDEVNFDSANATNGGPCNFVGPNAVECDLGDLAPGDTVTVFISVTVDPAVPYGTTIINNVIVTSATTDPGGASDSENTLVNAEADLWIDKTGNFPTGNPSGTILYFLTVHNTSGCSADDPEVCGDGGPSDALDIVVTDILPSTAKKLPVEFVSENCVYDSSVHEVTCMEPVLKAGESVTFEIQVRAKGSLGAITNFAEVSSSTDDPDAGNNRDALLMTVKGGTGDSGGPGGGRGRGGGPKK